ncbi:MAG: pilus assembly protein PilP [Thermodesulfovibrionales bacterium]|nr:pilus assembly protein PilP [Thermodesulfovibrionales bacterium]
MKKTLILVFITLLLLTNCESQPPKTNVVLPKPQMPAEQIAQTQQPALPKDVGYEYNPQGRRDPFKSLIIKPEMAEKKKGLTPLEQDDISTFKLTAIVWSGDQFYALITLPDGKSYTAKKGTKLGLEGGVIHEITKDTVIVRHYLRDKKHKDIILKLRLEEQG